MEFRSFQKIARLSREVCVSEKIDGTNSCVYIGEDGEFICGSRNRWITPEDDNYGFARWAQEHREELLTMGPGTHYGEWWGCLSAETSVRLADGTLEKIGKIVNQRLPVSVQSYNFTTRSIEPKQVTEYKCGLATPDWLTIGFKRKFRGGRQAHLHITPNHILYTKNSFGYIQIAAGDLRIGDSLFLGLEHPGCLQRQHLGLRGYETHVYTPRNQPILRFTPDGTLRLHLDIAPYVPPEMKYKILPIFRSVTPLWDQACVGDDTRGDLAETEITSITDAYAQGNRSKLRYDIEVADNHNFFANGVLVHNSGIQRRYGLSGGDKRWSLFNVGRWCLHGQTPLAVPTADPRVTKTQDILPVCVGLVPVLWRGNFDDLDAEALLEGLRAHGSQAVPGFMQPEGIVVYHVAANVCFKKTLAGDAEPKSVRK